MADRRIRSSAEFRRAFVDLVNRAGDAEEDVRELRRNGASARRIQEAWRRVAETNYDLARRNFDFEGPLTPPRAASPSDDQLDNEYRMRFGWHQRNEEQRRERERERRAATASSQYEPPPSVVHPAISIAQARFELASQRLLEAMGSPGSVTPAALQQRESAVAVADRELRDALRTYGEEPDDQRNLFGSAAGGKRRGKRTHRRTGGGEEDDDRLRVLGMLFPHVRTPYNLPQSDKTAIKARVEDLIYDMDLNERAQPWSIYEDTTPLLRGDSGPKDKPFEQPLFWERDGNKRSFSTTLRQPIAVEFAFQEGPGEATPWMSTLRHTAGVPVLDVKRYWDETPADLQSQFLNRGGIVSAYEPYRKQLETVGGVEDYYNPKKAVQYMNAEREMLVMQPGYADGRDVAVEEPSSRVTITTHRLRPSGAPIDKDRRVQHLLYGEELSRKEQAELNRSRGWTFDAADADTADIW